MESLSRRYLACCNSNLLLHKAFAWASLAIWSSKAWAFSANSRPRVTSAWLSVSETVERSSSLRLVLTFILASSSSICAFMEAFSRSMASTSSYLDAFCFDNSAIREVVSATAVHAEELLPYNTSSWLLKPLCRR